MDAVQYDKIFHRTLCTVTDVEHKSEFKITKNTHSSITLAGKLWGFYREDFGENWPIAGLLCTQNRHTIYSPL